VLFEILGPLRCAAGSAEIDLSGRREGRILAALLLTAGQVVSPHRLVDMLWGEEPPATARQQVQNCVTGLVRSLRDRGVHLPVRRLEAGYQLTVAREQLDAAVVQDEVAQARELAGAGRHRAAATAFRSALGRWRGPVLLGMDLGPFGPAAARLEELRLTTAEHLWELELGLGRHREVIADLAAEVAANPSRERLVAQYMRALAGTGRAAEALAVFHRTSRMLWKEYAIEPGPELRSVQLAILRTTAAPPGPAAGPAGDWQRQLLAAVARAEAARRQLELALRAARDLTRAGTPPA
jgi:DNA-binding SARP family transcriptional activator